MIVNIFNTLKSGWSRVNDWVKRYDGRRPIPTLDSPETVGLYLILHAKYTGDLLGGAMDNYTHPERFQYAMETQTWNLPIDCDDYAIWAYQALLRIPGCEPTIVTLLDQGVVGSHVVCIYRTSKQCGVIDTNGHRLLTGRDPATICQTFTEIYAARGYRYVSATVTPYPF